MSETLQILTIGGSGFIGSKIVKLLQKAGKNVENLSYPNIDITNQDLVKKALTNHPAKIVINFAAYTDVKEAEKERNNKNGQAWKINVQGSKNVTKVANASGKYLIHISTDHVFPIINESKKLYPENIPFVDDPQKYSWYGFTKLMAEIEVLRNFPKAAIVRLAYPFGNIDQPKRDYLTKLIQSIKVGYGLFDDQQLTPTYIPILAEVLNKIIDLNLVGIYHCVCQNPTTPFEIGTYLNNKLHLNLKVKKGSLVELEKMNGKQPYTQFGGLDTLKTQKLLDMKFPTWQEAIDDFVPELKLFSK